MSCRTFYGTRVRHGCCKEASPLARWPAISARRRRSSRRPMGTTRRTICRTRVAHFVGEAWATCNERRTDEMTKCLNYSGGRDRDRPCDTYDVNVVLSRWATRPFTKTAGVGAV